MSLITNMVSLAVIPHLSIIPRLCYTVTARQFSSPSIDCIIFETLNYQSRKCSRVMLINWAT
jgi:hypothetical protein